MSRAGNRAAPRIPARVDLPAGPEGGFTLIETLAVVAILAIAAAAMAMLSPQSGSGAKLRAATEVLASKLRQARTSAILTRRTQRVLIDVSSRTVWSDTGGQPLQLDERVALTLTAASPTLRSRSAAAINFYPNGSASGGAIRLQSKGKSHEIRVNWLTGRITSRERQ